MPTASRKRAGGRSCGCVHARTCGKGAERRTRPPPPPPLALPQVAHARPRQPATPACCTSAPPYAPLTLHNGLANGLPSNQQELEPLIASRGSHLAFEEVAGSAAGGDALEQRGGQRGLHSLLRAAGDLEGQHALLLPLPLRNSDCCCPATIVAGSTLFLMHFPTHRIALVVQHVRMLPLCRLVADASAACTWQGGWGWGVRVVVVVVGGGWWVCGGGGGWVGGGGGGGGGGGRWLHNAAKHGCKPQARQRATGDKRPQGSLCPSASVSHLRKRSRSRSRLQAQAAGVRQEGAVRGQATGGSGAGRRIHLGRRRCL